MSNRSWDRAEFAHVSIGLKAERILGKKVDTPAFAPEWLRKLGTDAEAVA